MYIEKCKDNNRESIINLYLFVNFKHNIIHDNLPTCGGSSQVRLFMAHSKVSGVGLVPLMLNQCGLGSPVLTLSVKNLFDCLIN